jgi:esterase
MANLNHFHYQITGPEEAPKAVFLHGLLGSGANWRKITSHLQDRFHILVFDQRGHGRSFHPESGYRPEDYADDLSQILDEMNWPKIHLIGHSLGGRNALNFAFRHPERVKSLTIEDIGPEPAPGSMDKIKRLLELVPVPFSSRAEAKEFFEDEFPKRLMGQGQSNTLANFFFTNIVEQPDGTSHWRFSLKGVYESLESGHSVDRWEEVKNLQMPTLWIRGERSQDLTPETFQKIRIVNPQIKGVEVARSGHWVHFDQPEEFTRILREFLLENLK